jgi:uncharacterized protein YjiS (DUF1127 family)
MKTYAYTMNAPATAARMPVSPAPQADESLLQILLRPFARAQVVSELRGLDSRMLSDIGITQSDIAHVAACSVDGKDEWMIVSLAKYAMRKLSVSRRRHEAYRTLMALDDRTLSDIGLERDEIPALVKVMHGQYQSPSVDGAFETEIVQPLRQWRLWQVAHKQLSRLDNRTLSDIGLVRGDIDWVAEELATRAVAKPANANTVAPKAA